MLKTLTAKLLDRGLNEIVFTDHNLDSVIGDIVNLDDCKYFEDVRSATFFAFGQSKLHHKPTVLFVDNDYISNCYTALIEIWMQRIPVIIISYNSDNISSIQYLRRCIDAVYELSSVTDLDHIIEKCNNSNGPILIRISEGYDNGLYNSYNCLLKSITKQYDSDKILCFNIEPNEMREFGVHSIEKKYKYGILSKYVGKLMSGKKYILVIPDYILDLESNIFNIRNLPITFKVYVKQTKENFVKRYQNWMTSNNIVIKDINEITNNVSEPNIPTIIVF